LRVSKTRETSMAEDFNKPSVLIPKLHGNIDVNMRFYF